MWKLESKASANLGWAVYLGRGLQGVSDHKIVGSPVKM